MTCASAASLASHDRCSAGPGSPTSGASFYLLASITVTLLAGSSAPTPLYPIYQAEWDFSSATLTLIFGIYALALLGALLIAGRLSDHVGRRPVLLVATTIQALVMVQFSMAEGVAGLLVARVIQGISTGAAIAAVGAGLLDLNKKTGAIANAVAPGLGTALGAIVSGLMVSYLPAPTHLVYLALSTVFALQAVAVWRMPETGAPHRGAFASLKPRLSLPVSVRAAVIVALPLLVAAWALAGFYASLAPMLLHRTFGLDASLAGGIGLFALTGSGAAAVLILRDRGAQPLMSVGAGALMIGTAITLVSFWLRVPAAFFLGTILAGTGFGCGFQGVIRTVVPFAASNERAGVLSVIFVVSYLAMGLPAIVAGLVVSRGGNVLATSVGFGTIVVALAGLGLRGALQPRSK